MDRIERPWRTLWRLARPHRGRFALVALLAALGAGASLCEPLVYRMAVNDIAGVFVGRATAGVEESAAPGPASPRANPRRPLTPAAKREARPHHEVRRPLEPHRRGHVAPRTAEQMFRTLLLAVALLFATGLGAQLFEVLADDVAATAANRIEEDFIRSTYAHVLRLRLRFFAPRGSGAIAKQIDQSDQVAPIVVAFAKDVLPEAFRVVGTFAIMFTQSTRLTAVALATVPAYLWIARRSARDLETDLPRYYTLWEEVSARIRDAIGAIKTVKLSGAEAREVARLSEASSAAYATYLQRNRLANRYLFLQSAMQRLGQALVLAYGGTKALQHQLTPGDVVMFVTYLDKLYDPIDSLTSLAKTLQEHATSVGRALGLLRASDEEPGGGALADGPGRVEFRAVRFGYLPGREVLHGVDFTLEPGAVTALVGPSGAGKTTLVDLLLRLHEPTGGEILIDGRPLRDVDPEALRRAISVVSADGAVFRGSLADNIRYKRPDASDAEVEEAARAAGLARALERLPAGAATEIGEGGVGLSVGERQRLQIARAFVSRPRILVLDEATANLDYATELDIKSALATMRGGRTTLVIAHRYSMVQDADHVVVIDGGRVVEDGSPVALVASGGWFAKLAASAAGAAAPLEPVHAAEVPASEPDADEDD